MKKIVLVLVSLVYIYAIELKTVEFNLKDYNVVATYHEIKSTRAVVYVHGYNDYFFNQELAQRFVDNGYSFYAIDLHGYGKSATKGKTDFYMSDIADYYPEITKTIEYAKSLGALKIVLLGHSQGGLITSLYAKDIGGIDALVLNSPFFGFYTSWFNKYIALPVVGLLSHFNPHGVMAGGETNIYGENLYKKYHFDSNLKHLVSQDKPLAWFDALMIAQGRVMSGLNLSIPTLLLHSSRSGIEDSLDIENSDVVLDIQDMKNGAKNLSKNIELIAIDGAIHDIFLSKESAKNKAYDKMFEFFSTNKITTD